MCYSLRPSEFTTQESPETCRNKIWLWLIDEYFSEGVVVVFLDHPIPAFKRGYSSMAYLRITQTYFH